MPDQDTCELPGRDQLGKDSISGNAPQATEKLYLCSLLVWLAFCCNKILVDMAGAKVSFAAGSCGCYALCVHFVHRSRHKPACRAVRPTVKHCWAPSGRGEHDMLKTASTKTYRLCKNDGVCAHPHACDMLRSGPVQRPTAAIFPGRPKHRSV